MTNAITIRRDDAANYVIESDCWGILTTERLDTALEHVRQIVEQWNIRIESLRREPEKWSVKGPSELPS